MKRIALIFGILVSIVSVQARDVAGLKDLQQSDTFSVRITVPVSPKGQSSVWSFEETQKLDVGFHVLSVNKDSVRMAIKPTRWIIYYREPEKRYTAVYENSDYVRYYGGKTQFYLFENNSVVVSVNRNDGKFNIDYKAHIEDEENQYRKRWAKQLMEISNGLRLYGHSEPVSDLDLDFDNVINISLNGFLEDWNEEQTIPSFVDLGLDSDWKADTPTSLQLLSASFDLPPNTIVEFRAGEMPEDRVFLTLGSQKIYPQKYTAGIYEVYKFSFFLDAPRRAYIHDLILDLTPGDSIAAVSPNYTFQDYDLAGNGYANSAYTNAMAKFYNSRNAEQVEDADWDTFWEENIEHFHFTYNTYIRQMDDYWRESSRLSFNYWYMSEHIKRYNRRAAWDSFNPDLSDNEIPWTNPRFMTSFPFADHLYQPYKTYGELLKSFYNYKAFQANNSVLTGRKYFLSDGLTPAYYFANAVFSGYPRSYLTSETLKEMMLRFHLSFSEREYQDFMNMYNLQESEIKESLHCIARANEKVDPGQTSRD